jgi:hypothetical protein
MGCIAVLLGTAPVCRADTPAPLDLGRFYAYPGALSGPGSAASAGFALADRWAGDEPFDNPAAAPARGVLAAPVLQRVKRQDLAADYRSYDETAGYVDVAGGWLSLPVRGFGVVLYAGQPVLRREEQSFVAKPGQVPGTFASAGESREQRAGLAVSRAWRGGRLGLGVEWTRRDDSYEFYASSGELLGTQAVGFSGDAVGFQAGAIVPAGGRVQVGVALRWLPALEVSGEQRLEGQWLGAGGVTAVSATRAAGLEGGVSARVGLTAAARAIVSVGGRTARDWDGFDLAEGRTSSWGLGLEYAEPDQPLTVRCGVGQERQDGAPEPRAGAFALGLGWRLDPLQLDVAVLRRSVSRADQPTSYDDRVVGSLTVAF